MAFVDFTRRKDKENPRGGCELPERESHEQINSICNNIITTQHRSPRIHHRSIHQRQRAKRIEEARISQLVISGAIKLFFQGSCCAPSQSHGDCQAEKGISKQRKGAEGEGAEDEGEPIKKRAWTSNLRVTSSSSMTVC